MITRRRSSRRTAQQRFEQRFPFLTALHRGRRRRERAGGIPAAAGVELLEDRTLLATWQPQGPSPAINGQVENIVDDDAVVGAIHTVVAHPTDPDTLWIGAVNGGVWRTNNATAPQPDWTPLTDQQQSLSIGAIDLDPTDPTHQTLVVGIGRFSSLARLGGDRSGLLRSTDGGDTWTALNDPLLQGANLSGVIARGSLLMASANFFSSGSGLYRSTDTGATWTRVSGSNGLASGSVSDLVADPSNPDRFYAAVNEVGLFVTTDGGANWSNISSGDATLNTAMTSFGNNNAEMAVGSGGRLYVAVLENGQPSYIGYTDNQGGAWTAMDLPQTLESNGDIEGLNPRVKPGGQGAIHFSIVVDPTNQNIVYVGGDRQDFPFPNFLGANDFTGRLFRGDTAIAPTGAVPSPQWAHLTHSNQVPTIPNGGTASSSAPHADSREMVFDAAGDLIEVDDGGIYRRTDPRSNQGDWFSIMGDLQVTEFHDIAYDSNADILIGAAQDTGTTQQIFPGSPQWDSVLTADGGGVEVDDISVPGQSVRYVSFQFMGRFQKQIYDSNNTLLSVQFPALQVTGGGSFFFPRFYTPFKLNAIDGSRLIFGGGGATYESFDGAETLRDIAPGLVINNSLVSEAIAYGGSRFGVPNPDVLYLGSGANVYVRQTGTGSPVLASSYPGGTVVDVVLNPSDWSEAYVIDSRRVFRTQDAGMSWTNITADLPSGLTLWSLEYVPVSTGTGLLAGTNGGVYSFNPSSNSWKLFGTGMPHAPVADLEFDATDDVLVAGTLGRGAFLISNVSNELEPIAIELSQMTIAENAGVAATTATITRTGDLASELQVTLINGDPSEIDFLNGGKTITIPANEPSVSFAIDAVDDTLLDGTQAATITIQAPGFPDASTTVAVTDYETVTAEFSDSEILESDGPNATMLTITRSNTDTEAPPLYAVSGTDIHVFDDAGNLLDTIPVEYPGGNRPGGEFVRDLQVLADGRLAVSNGTNQLYLSLYNPQNGSWIHMTAPGLTASSDQSKGGIAADDQFVYLTDVNSAAGPETGIVRFPITGGPVTRFANTDSSERLFATSLGAPAASGILEIDPQTGAILNRFDAPDTQGVRDGLAFDGVSLWFLGSDVNENVIYELDPDDGSVIRTHTVPANSGFDGLAALNGYIYLLDSFIDNRIIAYNPATGLVDRTLDLPFNISGGLTAIKNPDALLVTDTFTEDIYEVDPVRGITNRVWTQDLGIGDLGLASVGGEIYVTRNTATSTDGNEIAIYDRLGNRTRSIIVSGSIGMQSLGGDGVPAQVPSTTSFRDVAVGLDGLIYSLDDAGSSVFVHQPGSLQQQALISLATPINALAVDADGIIFGANGSGYVIQFAGDGTQIDSTNLTSSALIDIDLSTLGELLIGTISGSVLRTTVNLEQPREFTGSVDAAFVSFGAFGGVNSGDLEVTLVNGDESEISLPATVVIPTGTQSITIPVAARDDAELDGTQTVSVTPTASRYVSVADTIDVLDQELLMLTIDKDTVYEGEKATATLSRGNADGPFTFRNSFEVFGNTNVALPDLTTVQDTVDVADVAAAIADVNVHLDITHPWNADLDVFLIAPWGERVELFSDIGLDGDNFTDTILDDEGTTRIVNGSAPFTGRFRPAQPLSVLQGHSPNGTWTLEITDDNIRHVGTLNSWHVEFTVLGLAPLDVMISSNDPSEASVPQFVRLGTNQTSTTFTVDALIDSQLDGPQPVSISATSPGYDNAPVDSLTVIDGERPVFTSPEAHAPPAPLFAWDAPANSIRFDLWVADISNGVSQFIRKTVENANEFQAPALDDGIYRAWVRAFNADGDASRWSAPLNFTTATIPERVSITTPRSTISDTLPTFEWTAASSAVRYDLWVSNRTTGQDQIIRERNIPSTSFTPDAGNIGFGLSELPAGEYVAWVRGINLIDQPGPWSVAQKFTIVADVPVPGIAQPIGPEYAVSTRQPTLQWKAATNAYSYVLWVDNLTSGERQHILELELATTSYVPDFDLANGDYRFWVRATNSEGEAGPWSRAVDFSVTDDVPTPDAPVILMPDELEVDSLPLFQWTSVANAVEYELQVNRLQFDAQSVTRTQVIHVNLAATRYQTQQPLTNSLHEIRVRAINSEGEKGDWSRAVQFLVAWNDQAPQIDVPLTEDSSQTEHGDRSADSTVPMDAELIRRFIQIAGERLDASGLGAELSGDSTVHPMGDVRQPAAAELVSRDGADRSVQRVDRRLTRDADMPAAVSGPDVDAVMRGWPSNIWWNAAGGTENLREQVSLRVSEAETRAVSGGEDATERVGLLVAAMPLLFGGRLRRWHRRWKRKLTPDASRHRSRD